MMLTIASMSITSSFAQISTGSPSANVIKTGNRPEAGDWGLFVGVSYSDFQNIFSDDVTFEGFPLVNLKYYTSENCELRLGMVFQGTSEKYSGDMMNGDDSTTDISYKKSQGTNRLVPGIAYHFDSKNLLDVYLGANMPIGWNRYSVKEISGDYEMTSKQTPFIVGLGGFIGLQAFVADLPVAIGLEYGISFWKEFGKGKTKNTYSYDGTEQEYYTYDGMNSSQFESLKSSSRTTSNEIRLTVSYYFNK